MGGWLWLWPGPTKAMTSNGIDLEGVEKWKRSWL